VTPRTLTIDELERWMLLGGKLGIVELSDEQAVVDLCACTGERVEHGRSGTPR
jgi:hypothetical protein